MYIKNIELKDFRNYEKLSLEFHKKVNILLGDNAQGKTNLLEAIYITSLGKSFRTTRDNEMIRFGEEFCRVKITADKDEENLIVELVISEKGKAIKIDGVKAKKASDLLEHIYIVVFSPEDLKIVKDEPEKRRRFIDRELCQLKPSYYNLLSDYKKVLHQRNAYLKENVIDESALDIWDIKLSEYGSKIMLQRVEFVEKIQKISSKIHKKITDEKELLKITYEPSVKLVQMEDIQNYRNYNALRAQKEYFQETLKETKRGDLYNRNTSKGPHKDDLRISINGIDIRHFGSQGQQRTAALSLKLSEIKLIKEETGENAVLLLDDVLSELDNSRQNFLINAFEDVQLFITTTALTEGVKKALPEGKNFYVNNGYIKE